MLAYLHSLTAFVAAYPHLAYAIVFLAALLEAVPIAGVVVPGSVLIIGVSALVPTGAVSLWPLILFAIAGAIIGDGFSYWLGRRYGRQILLRWPFSKYPQIEAQSEAFFHAHGGKSVFLGRFVPALRAFVPLFAGILQMPVRTFYLFNILSAFAWAPAHVLPGVLLGASLSMAEAVVGRLALLAFALLLLLWTVTWIVRYVMGRGMPLISSFEDWIKAWASKRQTWIQRHVHSLFDPTRPELRGLILAGIVLSGAVWLFLGILEDVVSGDPLVRADAAVYALLQNIRTPIGDTVIIAITELGDSAVTISMTVAILAYLLWQKAWRTAGYWIAAVSFASIFNTLIKVTVYRARPITELYAGWSNLSFPSGHATVNTVLYGFLAFLIARELGSKQRVPVIVAAVSFITLIAFSRIYLGAHWFSDVIGSLAFGAGWIIVLAVGYIHHNPKSFRPNGLLLVTAAALIIAGSVNIYAKNAVDQKRYAVRQEVTTLSYGDWPILSWKQFPACRIDITGEDEEPLTIQWLGNLSQLREPLIHGGWQEPSRWTIRNSLIWLVPNTPSAELPVLPLLHDGHAPTMILIKPNSDGTRLVLRMWATNVELSGYNSATRILWVGSVVEERFDRLLSLVTVSRTQPDFDKPLKAVGLAPSNSVLVQRSDLVKCKAWNGQVLLSQDTSVTTK